MALLSLCHLKCRVHYTLKMCINYLLICAHISSVLCYHNRLFTLTSYENISESHCGFYNLESGDSKRAETYSHKGTTRPGASGHISAFTYVTISGSSLPPVDPMIQFEESIYRVLYGRDPDPQPFKKRDESENITSNGTDMMAHYPTGQGFRGEVFQNKSAVHLPFLEFVHRGHCHLRITKDYMQTAINAFAIFVAGNLDDILRLPSQYVLHSARTIAMMKIAREKLAATWTVVKGSTPTEAITYEVLEKYRPLFKYLTGKEMAKLNLTDERILSYIGTHPDLSRHQVGVVASRYIQINPAWTEPKYLNMMNNLLCGVPMIFMRRIPENTYLQLTHQIFYHIRACDPLQRRFYLAMMMRTQALGKSYSWSAREVSRLGLLLAEVTGQDLSAINPEAMSGITAQVMLEMPIHSLKSITEMQLRYLEPKPLNILAKKLIAYQNQQLAASGGPNNIPNCSLISVTSILFQISSIILSIQSLY